MMKKPPPSISIVALRFTPVRAIACAASIAVSLSGCLGTSSIIESKKSATGSGSGSGSVDPSAYTSRPGARVVFEHTHFYSLMEPHPQSGCAGDAKTYLETLALDASTGKPTAFPSDGTVSLRPDFIKDISVDITDANTTSRFNSSYSCSYGAQGGTVPPNSCATFDYGALSGVAGDLSGSVIFVGGLQTENYTSLLTSATTAVPTFSTTGMGLACGLSGNSSGSTYNGCASGAFALGIDTLSAESAGTDLAPGLATGSVTDKISSWSRLGAANASTAPAGAAGSGMAYSAHLGKLLLFGGASAFSAADTTFTGSDTVNTWLFDVKTQEWTLSAPIPYAAPGVTDLQNQCQLSVDTSVASGGIDCLVQWPAAALTQVAPARALFAMLPVPHFAIQQMTPVESPTAFLPAVSVDTTDRIVIAGGMGASGALSDAYRFNPTFGPDWVDAGDWENANNPLNDGSADDEDPAGMNLGGPGATILRQWMNSYHTNIISSTTPRSLLRPKFYEGSTGNDSADFNQYKVPMFGFGAAPIYYGGAYGTGTFLTWGGFDYSQLKSTVANGATGWTAGVQLARRPSSVAGTPNTELAMPVKPGNFVMAPTKLDSGTPLSPVTYEDVTATYQGLGVNVESYGGLSMEPGFVNGGVKNSFVIWGGSRCRDYLLNTGAPCLAAGAPDFNTSSYEIALPTTPGGAPSLLRTITGSPARAGMASARGFDPYENPMIVAWGGMDVAGTHPTANTNTVYVLGATGNWVAKTPTGTLPPVAANGAMVYSHATGRFYLFGGYNTTSQTQGDTYELTLGDCSTPTFGACTAVWRKLDASAGLTCYPNCPVARRSHRMVEVNYNNVDPNADVTASTCTAAAPCSFGIFMQGGTNNGNSLLSERWMFDPTANLGAGHWQRVDGFPPRHFGHLTNVDYIHQNAMVPVHRAVLFGGETGMANPGASGAGNYVAPTLGDTWVYDYGNNTWQRVKLLGLGYAGPPPTSGSELDYRQSYDARSVAGGGSTPLRVYQDSVFSPPPIAGGMMVTRTKRQGVPLTLPEVYLFGGRLKDGGYSPFATMYKFCLGSSGERPYNPAEPGWSASYDTALCDAYDETTNSGSTSPTNAYVGRWLRKSPAGLTLGAYQGAAAYDSNQDRIVAFGGLQTTTPLVSKVTDGTYVVTAPSVHEYTFATSANPAVGATAAAEGSWTTVPTCGSSLNPGARYGHSLHYDESSQSLILVGGYSATTGLLLTQTQLDDKTSTTYSTPDIWIGRKNTTSNCYSWTPKTNLGNSTAYVTRTPPTTGLAHAASVYIPGGNYRTGHYTFQDLSCEGTSPVQSLDPLQNRQHSGGVYIDLDRSKLGETENVLLSVKYLPLGPENTRPDATYMDESEQAVINVHLVRTNMDHSALITSPQPRYLRFFDTVYYPRIVKTLSVMSAPTGQPREDQLLLPISADPDIDRIHLERVSGSAIIIDASIIRLNSPQ